MLLLPEAFGRSLNNGRSIAADSSSVSAQAVSKSAAPMVIVDFKDGAREWAGRPVFNCQPVLVLAGYGIQRPLSHSRRGRLSLLSPELLLKLGKLLHGNLLLLVQDLMNALHLFNLSSCCQRTPSHL